MTLDSFPDTEHNELIRAWGLLRTVTVVQGSARQAQLGELQGAIPEGWLNSPGTSCL